MTVVGSLVGEDKRSHRHPFLFSSELNCSQYDMKASTASWGYSMHVLFFIFSRSLLLQRAGRHSKVSCGNSELKSDRWLISWLQATRDWCGDTAEGKEAPPKKTPTTHDMILFTAMSQAGWNKDTGCREEDQALGLWRQETDMEGGWGLEGVCVKSAQLCAIESRSRRGFL